MSDEKPMGQVNGHGFSERYSASCIKSMVDGRTPPTTGQQRSQKPSAVA